MKNASLKMGVPDAAKRLVNVLEKIRKWTCTNKFEIK
jgi:UDP-N-acetylglucosamine--N-acetylmuramyl-(pentapeptide) pyrophosphoryl-undecaprenol N-acetylglucosamine transferase